MTGTYFQDFKRDNGFPITVEYSARAGESDFDYPGHICDGGGSGPEIIILNAWPDTPGHMRLAIIAARLSFSRKTALGRRMGRVVAWPVHLLMRLDEWWRASLTDAEIERFSDWLAEHYVDDDDAGFVL